MVAEAEELVTVMEPPLTNTRATEFDSLPTSRLDERTMLPPVKETVPDAVLVATAATLRPSACTRPLETTNCPTPSRPTQMGWSTTSKCPPATNTAPVAPLNRPMDRSSVNWINPFVCTISVPCEPSCRATDMFPSDTVALETIIWPTPSSPTRVMLVWLLAICN